MSNPIFPYGKPSYIALSEQSGQWLPFVHFADNLLHLLKLPDVFDFDSFTDLPFSGPPPMPNSPFAVIGFGTDKPQVHMYYFANNSTLQGIYWAFGMPAYAVGSNLGPVVRGSTTLYATVQADGNTLRQIRVGYQSPSDPTTITESVFTGGPEGWVSRTYPKLMS